MQAADVSIFSEEDYLAWEELQEDKYEYYQAEVFAMEGVRREHVVVSLNIAALLKQHLGTPCQTYISDMKLRIEQVDAYFFPDIMVSCSAKDQQAE